MILSKKPLITLLAAAGMVISNYAHADITITVNNASGNVGGTL